MRKITSGFTIVELLIVIIVISLLATLVIITYSGIRQRANEAAIAANMRNFNDQVELFRAASGGTYPMNATELEQLNLKIDPTQFAANPTVEANFLYCTTNDGQNYVLLVYSATGTMYYRTNTDSGTFTGSTNWSSTNYQGRCANVLPGSAANAYAGYDSSQTPPWQPWTNVQ